VRRDDAHALRPGAVLRERFELERQLGEGGMGRVFLAVDRELDAANRYVAIKVLGETFRQHPQALETLRREATNSRKLNHPNIVGVYHFDRDGAHVFMVMEYMRGQTVEVFQRTHPEGAPYADVLRIVRGCGEALAFMHERGVVHSDFKPSNVFLTEDGFIKVLDLGIARTIQQTIAIEGGSKAATLVAALTPQYASCEMFESAAPDARDDVFALAIVAYELLTGRHPFDRLNALEARRAKMEPRRPRGLASRPWRALRRALQFDRATRTPDVAKFLEEFGPRTRKAGWLPWAAAAAGIGIGALALYLMLARDPDRSFLEDALARPQDPRPAPQEQVDEWLRYGASDADAARAALAEGDYPAFQYYAGSSRLASGLALARGERVDDRSEAAAQLLDLSKVYVQAVALVVATDAEEGLRCVCDGLKLNPYEPDLRAHFRTRVEQDGRDVVTATCGTIEWRGAEPL
jgi:serine/threonine protein kinase